MARRAFRIVVFVGLAMCTAAAFAQSEEGHDQAAPADPAWAKQKAQTCAACHGKQGVSQNATFPVLAGQYENYLLHALKAYRDGQRKNAIMSGQVQGMTDAQLAAMAHYFSSQSKTPLHTPYVEQ